jgi:hypothetical protein
VKKIGIISGYKMNKTYDAWNNAERFEIQNSNPPLNGIEGLL